MKRLILVALFLISTITIASESTCYECITPFDQSIESVDEAEFLKQSKVWRSYSRQFIDTRTPENERVKLEFSLVEKLHSQVESFINIRNIVEQELAYLYLAHATLSAELAQRSTQGAKKRALAFTKFFLSSKPSKSEIYGRQAYESSKLAMLTDDARSPFFAVVFYNSVKGIQSKPFFSSLLFDQLGVDVNEELALIKEFLSKNETHQYVKDFLKGKKLNSIDQL